MHKTLVCTTLCLLAGPAMADGADIELGEPEYGGTGCPEGTVSAVLSHDKQTMTVLFDGYEAETDGDDTSAHASCNVAVPVQVPPGFAVSLLEIDYRGYAEIPFGARGSFRVEYFFAGMHAPLSNTNIWGQYDDNFTIHDALSVATPIWSECGTDVILRSNSTLKVDKFISSEDQVHIRAIQRIQAGSRSPPGRLLG